MHPTTKPSPRTQKQVAVLRARALAYPETHEDFPWGHSAFKVRSKAFAFLHADAEGFSISVKLPASNALALELPFAEPTGYGLGKSGWVSARFAANQDAPLSMLESWLEESYTAIAPKRLAKALASGAEKATPKRAARAARGRGAASEPAPRTAAKRARATPRKPAARAAGGTARKKTAAKAAKQRTR